MEGYLAGEGKQGLAVLFQGRGRHLLHYECHPASEVTNEPDARQEKQAGRAFVSTAFMKTESRKASRASASASRYRQARRARRGCGCDRGPVDRRTGNAAHHAYIPYRRHGDPNLRAVETGCEVGRF